MARKLQLRKELGYLRLAAAVPELRVADVSFNVKAIIELIRQAHTEGVQVITFPEMAVTGYTIQDLVQQSILLARAEAGLAEILQASRQSQMLIIVGMPVAAEQKIFNCAVILNSGQILGVIPKSRLPDYREFYDERWFASGDDVTSDSLELAGQKAPFGTDILFKLRGSSTIIGVEICEDLWVALAPHEYQALAGATVLINLSASNEVLGKAEWRRTLVSAESGRCLAAYCYVSSGIGESANDIVFGGHSIIAENGSILQESRRLTAGPYLTLADIDLERLAFDRQQWTSFQDGRRQTKVFRVQEVEVNDTDSGQIYRAIDPHPFVPADPAQRAERCREIFSMQVAALAEKLTGSQLNRIVLGVSGGLDSTLALLVAAKTMDFRGLPRQNIYTYTLPGFGTTSRTRLNATKLCQALGVSFAQVNIRRTCLSQLKDLEHDGKVEDIVFENVQARYRTAFLFNKANELNGLNLGTGDLTEIALGWCTFAGDQMSHYHVNASVPKTLVRYLVRWVADEELPAGPAQRVLYDVLDTPISPELRRPLKGQIAQMSEDVIGPVELSDFFLYPFIRFGMRPGKILFLADLTSREGLFEQIYTLDELRNWLLSFIRRFFANQFKRTCLPEGPKIGTVSLSPRGDWRMPSDADAGLWLEDVENMYRKLQD